MNNKNTLEVFKNVAEANECIYGSLGKGKKFSQRERHHPNENERLLKSSTEILSSTSKDA